MHVAISPLQMRQSAQCHPPSRRIIRKLRLGYSLKRCEGGFLLDCTAQRSHKTSKFYGER